jgi:hypothetical protein
LIKRVEENWPEPRTTGQRPNLPGFVVRAHLEGWSVPWVMPDTGFAMPLTSMVLILCSAFGRPRRVPILLSQDAARRVLRRPAGLGST